MVARSDLSDPAGLDEAFRLVSKLRRPGQECISDAADVSSSGTKLVFSGLIADKLVGEPVSRIYEFDIGSETKTQLTHGPGQDRSARISPDGQTVAFLSDRKAAGEFQLYLLDRKSLKVTEAPKVTGWLEYLDWSPNGGRILMGIADHGVDVAGGRGGIASRSKGPGRSSWFPEILSSDSSPGKRSIAVYELGSRTVQSIVLAKNAWEATWCGNDAIAAIVSDGPEEHHWYTAEIVFIDLKTGQERHVFKPRHQLGGIAASRSGHQIGFIEAISSDRGIIAGDARIFDRRMETVTRIDTNGVDVSFLRWISEEELLFAGHRGFETVVAIGSPSQKPAEIWKSAELSTTGYYASICPIGKRGDFALIADGFQVAPELAVVIDKTYKTLWSFDLGYGRSARAIELVEQLRWTSSDGTSIEGWLLRPNARAPFPLIMLLHGGPVWLWRSHWLGKSAIYVLMLLQRGYAIFLPNPRGSAGYGHDFVRPVVGDIGGVDSSDLLCGIEKLVDDGIADASRIGVMGQSYGGFMTSWLVTQSRRFSAAIAVSPHTNHVTQFLLSNIPYFTTVYLGEDFSDTAVKFFEKSPVTHVAKVTAPVLGICGSLDRCTPSEEALQFHNALVLNGKRSSLCIYPEEGHGVRKWPASIDFSARVADWFDLHLRKQP